MLNDDARRILGFLPTESLSTDKIKRRYREYALKYHPDKNPEPCANERFIDINEAYKHLLETDVCLDFAKNDYRSIFFTFMDGLFLTPALSETVYAIVTKMTALCTVENVHAELDKIVEKIDITTLVSIHNILTVYKDTFQTSSVLLDYISSAIETKTHILTNRECIVLRPRIDDLLDCKLYKLVDEDQTYIVPLWHSNLSYDKCDGTEFVVKCIPMLSPNIRVDEDGNVFAEISISVKEIWDLDNVPFFIGDTEMFVPKTDLRLSKTQSLVIKKKGVPKTRIVKNIFDVSSRGDIILHIHLIL